jgi:hypothetical protein
MSINSEWFLTDSFLAQRILTDSGLPLAADVFHPVIMVKLADTDGELTNPILGPMQYVAGEDYIIKQPTGGYVVKSKSIFDVNFKRV